MSDAIEQTILRLLGQVSVDEKLRNKALEKRTARVLKALAYMKSVSANSKMGA